LPLHTCNHDLIQAMLLLLGFPSLRLCYLGKTHRAHHEHHPPLPPSVAFRNRPNQPSSFFVLLDQSVLPNRWLLPVLPLAFLPVLSANIDQSSSTCKNSNTKLTRAEFTYIGYGFLFLLLLFHTKQSRSLVI